MRIKIQLGFFLTLLSLMLYTGSKGECLPGYRADASRCYKMMRYGSNDSRSWSRSRVACRKFGGDLASLETSGEILIADQLRKDSGMNSSDFYWIGLVVNGFQGTGIQNKTFRWLSGSYLNGSNSPWMSGEPSRHSLEDTVVASGRGWADRPATWLMRDKTGKTIIGEPKGFLCESGALLMGKPGKRGTQGLKGPPGPRGRKGPAGTMGLPGPTGVRFIIDKEPMTSPPPASTESNVGRTSDYTGGIQEPLGPGFPLEAEPWTGNEDWEVWPGPVRWQGIATTERPRSTANPGTTPYKRNEEKCQYPACVRPGTTASHTMKAFPALLRKLEERYPRLKVGKSDETQGRNANGQRFFDGNRYSELSKNVTLRKMATDRLASNGHASNLSTESLPPPILDIDQGPDEKKIPANKEERISPSSPLPLLEPIGLYQTQDLRNLKNDNPPNSFPMEPLGLFPSLNGANSNPNIQSKTGPFIGQEGHHGRWLPPGTRHRQNGGVTWTPWKQPGQFPPSHASNGGNNRIKIEGAFSKNDWQKFVAKQAGLREDLMGTWEQIDHMIEEGDEFCHQRKPGAYAHPNSCNKYVVCFENYRGTEFYCGANRKWSGNTCVVDISCNPHPGIAWAQPGHKASVAEPDISSQDDAEYERHLKEHTVTSGVAKLAILVLIVLLAFGSQWCLRSGRQKTTMSRDAAHNHGENTKH